MTSLERVTRDYRAAFMGYLPRREEAALHSAYRLGRAAVADGLSILDVAQMHHEVFLEVLRDTRSEDLTRVATAASDFFLEVLATYDMTLRGVVEQSGS